MLRKQDFLPVALSLLFNTSQIHLFPLVSFGLERWWVVFWPGTN